MRALPSQRIVLGGEAVAHCLDGLPDFHRLLGDGQASACLYAFDLIHIDGQDLRGLELIKRPQALQKALRKAGPAVDERDVRPRTTMAATTGRMYRRLHRGPGQAVRSETANASSAIPALI
jgi:bifunctional non-homologous end joining protein LigD